jgi:hypothetical protein
MPRTIADNQSLVSCLAQGFSPGPGHCFFVVVYNDAPLDCTPDLDPSASLDAVNCRAAA